MLSRPGSDGFRPPHDGTRGAGVSSAVSRGAAACRRARPAGRPSRTATGLRRTRAVGAATTRFIWDGQKLILETDGGGTTQAQFTLGQGVYGDLISQRRSSTSRWYHFDALGSTDRLTGADGSATDTYIYKAFGPLAASTGSTTNPFRYVGKLGYHDQGSGPLYVRARWLRPTTGSWLSVDPVRGEPRYPYARGAPASVADAGGRISVDPISCAGLEQTLKDLLDNFIASANQKGCVAPDLWPYLNDAYNDPYMVIVCDTSLPDGPAPPWWPGPGPSPCHKTTGTGRRGGYTSCDYHYIAWCPPMPFSLETADCVLFHELVHQPMCRAHPGAGKDEQERMAYECQMNCVDDPLRCLPPPPPDAPADLCPECCGLLLGDRWSVVTCWLEWYAFEACKQLGVAPGGSVRRVYVPSEGCRYWGCHFLCWTSGPPPIPVLPTVGM